MNINIVHLPHTFEYLLDLSHAFHHNGFKSVTLVANGFDYESIKKLRRHTAAYSYFKILDIPSKRIWSHGEALNYAFDQSDDELFCFADHDIFPTKEIVGEIKHALKDADVVCFGDRPENFVTNYRGFAASARKTQSGVSLATSFFSVFKRTSAQAVKCKFQIGFEQYFRHSQLPQFLTDHVDVQQLNEPFLIDTCKALSVAIIEQGGSIAHSESKNVFHFGGLCGAINRFKTEGGVIKHEFILPKQPGKEELVSFYKENQRRHPKVMELKRSISDYSLHLLMALKQGKPIPKVISNDFALVETIDMLTKAAKGVFKD